MGERAAPEASDASSSDLTRALSQCRSSLELRLSALRDDAPRKAALEVLRADISDFAARSRQLDIPPERLLVSFKEMVRDLSVIQAWGMVERGVVMDALVQMTIESYYSGDHERR